MNIFKNHISLILALVTMLISIQSFLSFHNILTNYKIKLNEDYSLIVASNTRLTLEQFQSISPYFVSVENIDPSSTINSLKANLSEANLALLRVSLPKFYRLHLNEYPSANTLYKITEKLKKHNSIVNVESFSKTQNQLYTLLGLNHTVMLVFAILVTSITFLLVFRQMEVWRLKHNERMKIMSVFGAPMWLRSAVLYKLAVIDSFISFIIVSCLFWFLSIDRALKSFLDSLGMSSIEFKIEVDGLILLSVALIVSVFSVYFVVINSDEDA